MASTPPYSVSGHGPAAEQQSAIPALSVQAAKVGVLDVFASLVFGGIWARVSPGEYPFRGPQQRFDADAATDRDLQAWLDERSVVRLDLLSKPFADHHRAVDAG